MLPSVVLSARLERQVVDFGSRSCSVDRLGGDGRQVGHRSLGGRSLCVLGLQTPGADVGIPTAVVFARLDVYRDLVGSPLAEFAYIVGTVEEGDANLA